MGNIQGNRFFQTLFPCFKVIVKRRIQLLLFSATKLHHPVVVQISFVQLITGLKDEQPTVKCASDSLEYSLKFPNKVTKSQEWNPLEIINMDTFDSVRRKWNFGHRSSLYFTYLQATSWVLHLNHCSLQTPSTVATDIEFRVTDLLLAKPVTDC